VTPRVGLGALVLAALAVVVAAQEIPSPPSRPTGTGVITGRVMAGDTGRPLAGAYVRLSGRDWSATWAQETDERGRFEFSALPSGSFVLSAGHPRYLAATLGGFTDGGIGRPITLRDGERVERADITLLKQGAIEGRVLDEFGDPAPDIIVRAYTRTFVDGAYRLVAVGGSQADPTDDKGQFRLFGLVPGTYYLCALAGGFVGNTGRPPGAGGFAPTYYPGTSDAHRASGLTLAAGAEQAGVVMSLVPARSGRVTGRVVGIGAEPLIQATAVRLIPQAGDEPGPITASTFLKPDGSFTFNAIPAGTYLLLAHTISAYGPNRQDRVGWLSLISTGQDIDNVSLLLRRSVRLSGRIEVEGDGTRPALEDLRLEPLLVGPLAAGVTGLRPYVRTTIKPDWSFESNDVTGPMVIRLVARPGTPWRLSRVTLDGADVTDTRMDAAAFDGRNLEIAVTNRSASVRGRVVLSRGDPVTGCHVIVFAEDPSKWEYPSRHLTIVRPDQNGDFETRGLPPDRYLAIAMNRVEEGDWQDPEVLELLRQDATRVLLSEGEPMTVELRLQEWPRRR
jgi:hypothetical protein